MSAVNSSNPPPLKPTEFRRSLARNIVIILVALSFLPVALIGIFSTIRSRQILRDQAFAQVQSITRLLEIKIDSDAITADTTLRRLARDPEFSHDLTYILQNPSTAPDIANLRFTLKKFLDPAPGSSFVGLSMIMVLDKDGMVTASTIPQFENQNLLSTPPIGNLAGKTTTFTLYNPEPFFPKELVIFNARRIDDKNGNLIATLIAATLSPAPIESVQIAKSFSPTFQVYLQTSDSKFLSYNEISNNLYIVDLGEEFSDFLTSLAPVADTPEFVSRIAVNDYPTLYYARKLKQSNIKLITAVPESTIYAQINAITPQNAGLLGFSLLVVIGVVFVISTRLVRPLNQLVNNARQFAAGDWAQRAKITRRDEIGLLAFSFNSMVEQLSELYRSLEKKVEDRTTQIRLAAEVAQLATSAAQREEILRRTVDLLVERFDYLYARAFVLDEAGSYAILEEESRNPDGGASRKGMRIRVSDSSLVGWVAANNQARTIANVEETIHPQDPPVSGTKSQVALPVSVSGQILGILDIQSSRPNDFDADTVSVLSTLATQVANGLQNIRLLEATTFNLQETTLYYRTSLQVTQAQEENEVLQLLINALQQTPFVSGVFSVHEDRLEMLALHDPRSPNPKSPAQNTTTSFRTPAHRLLESSLTIVDSASKPAELNPLLSFFFQRGCQSAALFSMQTGGSLAQIVVVGSREKGTLSETSLQPLANLIGMASATLERFEIQKTLANRISELQLLSSISQALSGVTDVQKLYEILHKQIARRVGEDTGFLMALYDQETDSIEIPYLYDGSESISLEPFPANEGLITHLIHSRVPLVMNRDVERRAQELGAKVLGKPAKSWLGIPLIFASEVIGAVVIQNAEKENCFTEDIVSLISTIAPQAAIAIRNAQLLNRAEDALKAYSQESYLLNTNLNNTPEFLYFKDSRGQYMRASLSYAEFLGLPSPSEMIGKTDFELQGQEIGAKTYQEEQNFLLSGETRASTVEKMTDEKGEEAYFQLTRIAMRDEGGVTIGLLGIAHDISELKKTEERAQYIAGQLLTASEIARDTAGTLNLDELLVKAVNLVLSRFNFYHSSIFLLDTLGEYAVLRESTGPAGERLKANRHKLAVGSQSVVGQATARKEPVIINDVTSSLDYYPNPLLPETRSELVIPLKIGEHVLGALDVQSERKNAFSPQDLEILQILADQLAIAVYNARLFTRSQNTLIQHRALYQITTTASAKGSTQDALLTVIDGLRETMNGDRVAIFLKNEERDDFILGASVGFSFQNPNQTIRLDEGVAGKCARERRAVLQSDQDTETNSLPLAMDTRSELAAPVIYANDLLGVLVLESPSPAAFDENDREILATLGNNLGTILNNIQLLEQIRSQVRRQQIIYSATSRIRRSVDLQTILETTATEICQALRVEKAHIEIAPRVHAAINEANSGPNSNGSEQEVKG